MKKKKVGRPKVLKRDFKNHKSIRLNDAATAMLIKKFGSVQAAVNSLIVGSDIEDGMIKRQGG